MAEPHDPMDPSSPEEKKPPRKRRNGDGNGPSEGGDPRLRELLGALQAAQDGDFAVRLPFTRGTGVMNDIARAFNSVVSRNEALSTEIVRLERVVGREGRMTERASLGEVSGGWAPGSQKYRATAIETISPMSLS